MNDWRSVALDPAELAAVLASGRDLNEQDREGNTLLHGLIAMRKATVELVTRLLDAGARIDIANENGKTAFAFACSDHFGEPPPLVEWLAHRVDVKRKPARGKTALGWAVFYAMSGSVRILVARGARASTLTKPAQLMLAVCLGDAGTVRALLASGVAPNAVIGWKEPYYGGYTPLQVAARDGAHEIVEILLGARVPADHGHKLRRPIAEAAQRGHVAIVARLLEAGSQHGEAALMRAVSTIISWSSSS